MLLCRVLPSVASLLLRIRPPKCEMRGVGVGEGVRGKRPHGRASEWVRWPSYTFGLDLAVMPHPRSRTERTKLGEFRAKRRESKTRFRAKLCKFVGFFEIHTRTRTRTRHPPNVQGGCALQLERVSGRAKARRRKAEAYVRVPYTYVHVYCVFK